VLNLLGREGPSTSSPSKYIRYIYNRLTLESANVRAAALSALAKFALGLPSLRPSISILLSRCLHDSDDEVRDRATLYLRLLQQDQDLAQKLILDTLPVPLDNLERCLKDYAANPSAQPFDIAVVPVTPIAPEVSDRRKHPLPGGFSPDVDRAPASRSTQLPAIPEFAALGPVFKTSTPQQLTESETEYVVNCVKHVFARHVVFQFNCTNTLDAQMLENVVVKMDASGAPGFKVEWELEASSLVYGVPGSAYVCASHDDETYPTGSFGNVLKFQVKDVDPSTGEADETGYEDQYPLDNLDVTVADYMKKTYCTSFKDEWQALGEDNELVERFALSTMKTIKDAVNEIIDFLGMQACDKTEVVPPKRTKHILLLSGAFVEDNAPALVRIRMKMDDSAPGVSMELTVRSTSPLASRLLSSAF
jgi:coatomer protein complex subunit gamma